MRDRTRRKVPDPVVTTPRASSTPLSRKRWKRPRKDHDDRHSSTFLVVHRDPSTPTTDPGTDPLSFPSPARPYDLFGPTTWDDGRRPLVRSGRRRIPKWAGTRRTVDDLTRPTPRHWRDTGYDHRTDHQVGGRENHRTKTRGPTGDGGGGQDLRGTTEERAADTRPRTGPGGVTQSTEVVGGSRREDSEPAVVTSTVGGEDTSVCCVGFD